MIVTRGTNKRKGGEWKWGRRVNRRRYPGKGYLNRFLKKEAKNYVRWGRITSAAASRALYRGTKLPKAIIDKILTFGWEPYEIVNRY